MIRNLKVLGLALVAMLAMGATSASAAEFHSEKAHTILKGTQSTVNTFSTHSGTIHCSTATFSGTVTTPTTTTVVVAPTYAGCKSTGFIEANVTVDTNGCDYTMTAHGTTASAVHLGTCNAGAPGIVVTAPFCTITVPTGQSLGQVHYETAGTAGPTHEIIVNATVNNIKYNESGFACANSGASTTGGTYTGKVRVTGQDANGNHVGITHTA